MKTAADPRHKKRQYLVKKLFTYSFRPEKKPEILITKIISKIKIIDPLIEKAAPQFPIAKLNKVDLAILRLSVFELIVEKKEPQKVIIDEAIELAKELGSDSSPKFVNGVLGTVLQEI